MTQAVPLPAVDGRGAAQINRTIASQRLITTSIDVVMCVRPQSLDVDQYVAVTLQSRATEAIDLDQAHVVKWKITDGVEVHAQHVTDGLPGDPFWGEGSTPDRSLYECYIDPRGTLPAMAERTLGFVFFRKNLVSRIGERYALVDPYHQTLVDQPTSVTLVLPEPCFVEAPGAHRCTTRLATWRFNSIGEQTSIVASWTHGNEDSGIDARLAALYVARTCRRLGTVPPPHLDMGDGPGARAGRPG